MKSLMWLLESILQDCSMRCGTETHRDFVTMSRRVEHEGISFLTITLPAFCKDFERSLEQEAVDPSAFRSFKKAGAIPRLFSGMLGQVFDQDSGRLLKQPSEDAVFCIRQACLMFKKVLLPCTHQRTQEAFDGYLQCENDIQRFREHAFTSGCPSNGPSSAWRGEWKEIFEQSSRVTPTNTVLERRLNRRLGGALFEDPFHLFGYVADAIWSTVLRRPDSLVSAMDLRPRHGPGATAERVNGNAKYKFSRWHERLEPYFPFTGYGIPSLNALDEESTLDSLDIIEPGAEQPVRVITVPKTLKAPRIIAVEPVCMQYTQQALALSMVEAIERHPLTAGHVNFSDQSINRELALSSSMDRSFGTIDLSEASDRVHKVLVERLLQTVPALLGAVMACRSTRANVPGVTEPVTLEKFASMGSALCFPIEAMVFYTIILVARCARLRRLPTSSELMELTRSVYVYGDDLIVPADEVPTIIMTLELFGLKVNHTKTFRASSFRESCGMDAYNGVKVTPTYLRRMPPDDRQSLADLPSYVSFRNQLYLAGFWKTARRVQEHIESIFGVLPHVHDTSPGLGWISYLGTMSYTKFDTKLHRPLVRTYVASIKEKRDPLNGYAALLKFFVGRGGEPLSLKSLSHSVLRGEANIKRRWVTPA